MFVNKKLDKLIKEIEKETKIGEKLVEMHLAYIKSFVKRADGLRQNTPKPHREGWMGSASVVLVG